MLRTERLLARAFFARLFESELMPAGLPQVQLIIWSVSMIAAPAFIVAFELQRGYTRLWRNDPARLPDAILDDELLFITYSMLTVGLVALVVWEGVFPDRRDVRTLGVLPLRPWTHVTARLTALAAVATLFCGGTNVMPALVYGAVLRSYEGAAGFLQGAAAHFLATGLAGFFVFFTVITAQGALLNLFGRRTAQRLALVLQSLFVVVLLQALMFVPYLGTLVRPALQDDAHTAAVFFPPVWFVALFNVVAGTPAAAPASFAVAAIAATAGSILVAAVLLAGSYARLVRMALETLDGRAPVREGLLWRVYRAATRRFAVNPVQSAVAGFSIRSVTRSRTHLILLAMYVGAGLAIAVSTLTPVLVTRGTNAVMTPHEAVLAAPLILNFCALAGLRVLFALPTDIRANWAVRSYAQDDRISDAVDGVRLALLLIVVLPVALAAALVGTALWGLSTGAASGVFTAAAGVLLADLLLVGLRKIPFTCTYYPGRSRGRTLWPLYVAAFSLYAFALASLEVLALNDWRILAGAFLAAAVVDRALAYARQHDLRAPPGLTYAEEDPDALFTGFRFSEALASESPPKPQ